MISVIGIGCIYPDAFSPIELWNNVLSKRRAFRKIPKNRIDLSYYDDGSNDSIYIKNASLIKNYEFDRKKFQISNSVFNSADLTHWLALDVAHRTLVDSGFLDGHGINKEKTAVIVGNTLTGEFSRSELMRLRWPYVKRLLESKLSKLNIDTNNFIKDFEKSYKEPFNEPNEDSLSGGLSNTIAGRISNYFDFNGGCFTVDGACSSSLVAVTQACTLLESNSIDYALVGGVDLSLDPFELIGFSRISAMSHGNMKVYDKNSDGFLPGEGCGFVLLTRSDNANSNGIKKYCDIIGWGISSDGSGGLTRPEVEGQKLAIQRACEKADISPNEITLFEGHGTGTVVGDSTELAALNQILNESKYKHYIGSIKANIGHTKAAAGMAGLIKSIMSLQTQIIPPITANENPHEEITKKDSKLDISKNCVCWPKNRPLIAGVSSFGFGGINSHVIVKNYTSEQKENLDNNQIQKNKTYQDYELILLDAETKEDLVNKINNLLTICDNLSFSELSDLSVELLKKINFDNNYRLSIICNYPIDLISKLQKTKMEILNNQDRIFDRSGIYYNEKQECSICFAFPGQAAPVRFNHGILKNWNIEKLELEIGDVKDTNIAQPAIISAEYSCYKLLEKLNIKSNYFIGHSLGELMSLYACDILDKEKLYYITKNRGDIMQNYSPKGNMIVVFCSHEKINNILKNNQNIDIAGYNSSNQIVLSGSSNDMDTLYLSLKKENINFSILPVTRMFHSRFMQEASLEWEKLLNTIEFNTNSTKKYISTITGTIIENQNVKNLLKEQFTKPVLFTKALSNIDKNDTLFIEVGPGNILQSLIMSDGGMCVSTDFGSDSFFGILSTIGSCFAFTKNKIETSALKNRFTKNIDIYAKNYFFSNPCETTQPKNQENKVLKTETINNDDKYSSNVLFLIKKLVSEKTELSIDSIKDSDHFLKDLHLNSINVGQIIADCCKRLEIQVSFPLSEFSNKTLSDSALFLESVLDESKNSFKTKTQNIEGLHNWIQAYEVKLQEQKLEQISSAKKDLVNTKNNWSIIYPKDYELSSLTQELSKDLSGQGIILCLNNTVDLDFLLSNTRKLIETKIDNLIVIQHGGFYSSFFNTLSQETNIKTLLIDLPYKTYNPNIVLEEFYNNQKNFCHVIYDQNYTRYIECFTILNKHDKQSIDLIKANDVIVVSGGGKGITHECCKQLAKNTQCKLAIIGRSSADDVSENMNNLTKLSIDYKYYSADICDSSQVASTIEQIKKDFGKIDGVLHGAGNNSPCLLENLNIDSFYRTYNPKVVGLKNLIENIKDEIKILVNFGSIIGRLGMVGQADYALSNAITSDMVVAFKTNHPSTRCLSLEWSVWSDVGMGANLGKIESLINDGIIPITVDSGVDEFVKIINTETDSCIIPIIGRLGNTCPFVSCFSNDIPFFRFLENVQVYYPNLELVCDFELSPTNDLYLDDHEFKGEKVFPAVMMIEASVQCYRALTGNDCIPHINNIVFDQPIVANKSVVVRVCCIKEHNVTKVAIRSSDTLFKINHFSCELTELHNKKFNNIKTPHDRNISTEYFYNHLLFQKNRFANINKYYSLLAFELCAKVSKAIKDPYFNRSFPQDMICGDPGLRDSCLHSVQPCVPDKILLPAKVDSIKILSLDDKQEKVVYASKVWEKDKDYCYNLMVCNTDGDVIEVWTNVIFKVLEDVSYKTWNKDLLACYLQRLLPTNSDIKIFFDDDITDIVYRTDGKPEHNSMNVSKSHCNHLTLVVTGADRVGCDIESVQPYRDKLLNDTNKNLCELLNKSLNENINITQTRVWTILESIKKSGLNLNDSITIDAITDKFIKFKVNKYKIYSFCENISNKLYCISILNYE
jgi:enediyne polyketide synthase